jgi:pimeloyl-ACP methyl ester carboxylesterase
MRELLIFAYLLFSSQYVLGQDGFAGKSPSLAYWTVGNNNTQIVIVLHGGPGAAHDYLRSEWDRLTKIAKVIYYDQSGCGKSEYANGYSHQQKYHCGYLPATNVSAASIIKPATFFGSVTITT